MIGPSAVHFAVDFAPTYGCRRIDEHEDTALAGWPRLRYWNEEPTVYERSVGRSPYLVLFYLRDDEPVIIAYAYAYEGESPATGRTESGQAPAGGGRLASSRGGGIAVGRGARGRQLLRR